MAIATGQLGPRVGQVGSVTGPTTGLLIATLGSLAAYDVQLPLQWRTWNAPTGADVKKEA